MNIYDLEIQKVDGSFKSMHDYEGKVLLVVNTATGCGFTPQYEGLQKLYDEFKNRGFEVLDFPCNQFGHQASGSNEELAEFCQLNYQTTFETFAKVDVNGEQEAPIFHYLKNAKGSMLGKAVKWNFTKFLVDREGNVIKRYAPTVNPEEIREDIIQAIQ